MLRKAFMERAQTYCRSHTIDVIGKLCSNNPVHYQVVRREIDAFQTRREAMRELACIPSNVIEVERKAGYKFSCPKLAERALFHSGRKLPMKKKKEPKKVNGAEEVEEEEQNLFHLLEFVGDGMVNSVTYFTFFGPRLPFPTKFDDVHGPFPARIAEVIVTLSKSNDFLGRIAILLGLWDNFEHALGPEVKNVIEVFKQSVLSGKYNVECPKILGDLTEAFAGSVFFDTIATPELFYRVWLRFLFLEQNPLIVLCEKLSTMGKGYPKIVRQGKTYHVMLENTSIGSAPTMMEACHIANENQQFTTNNT